MLLVRYIYEPIHNNENAKDHEMSFTHHKQFSRTKKYNILIFILTKPEQTTSSCFTLNYLGRHAKIILNNCNNC